jgi:hypothetical protein
MRMLQTVANGLGELKDRMVFVGGVVAELYADDPASSDIRPTLDVDCVIELSSRIEHAIMEDELRAKGFSNDVSEGAPICRWVYKDIKVDVMPTDDAILGFSNIWYVQGIENKIVKTLPTETEISVFPPAYYLAAKIEAHKGRGGNDLRQSHDFEDIIYLMDNCTVLYDNIVGAAGNLKAYLEHECDLLLQNKGLSEGIETALPIGSGAERTEMILELIKNIADIE